MKTTHKILGITSDGEVFIQWEDGEKDFLINPTPEEIGIAKGIAVINTSMLELKKAVEVQKDIKQCLALSPMHTEMTMTIALWHNQKVKVLESQIENLVKEML